MQHAQAFASAQPRRAASGSWHMGTLRRAQGLYGHSNGMFVTLQKRHAGWRERTTWEGGLRQTVDWYLTHGFKDYWDKADVEAALEPHPIIHPQTLLALGTPAL